MWCSGGSLRSGMMRSGTVYPLPPLAPLTAGTGSGLLPTPEASNTKAVAMRSGGREPRDFLKPLPRLTKDGLLTTPCADDTGYRKGKYAQGGTALSTQIGGQLNPTWVEWLMGFPLGWTALERSETPSSRKSRK